jgi:outer membrane protein assembly factor BamB
VKIAVFLTLTLLVAGGAAHPWQSYHGDPQHTGRSQYGVGDSLWTAWTYSAGGDISGSAVVNDQGQVIFGARDVHLYCLNPDGGVAWNANLESLGTSIYFSAPALDDEGNVYVTTNRKLVKVDTGGTVVWRYPEHSAWSISHSPVIGPDGNVYFACYSESLYAVRPDGTLDWARGVELDANSSPAVGYDGRVYVATTRGTAGWKLWAFEPNGDIAWAFPLADDADFASPAVGPDSVIYVGAGRYLYAVNPNGTLRWRDSLSANVHSCPAVANDSTLYVTAGARLYNVSADSGVRWRKYLGGSNYSSPAVDASGRVYVGSAAGAFYVVGADSTTLWSMPTPDDVWASPAIGTGGRVYFGCMDGSFYALEGDGVAVEEPADRVVVGRLRFEPNPTTGLVRFSGTGLGPVRAVRVFSPAGRGQHVRLLEGAVDLDGLPAGVYLVEVRHSDGRSLGKLVLR